MMNLQARAAAIWAMDHDLEAIAKRVRRLTDDARDKQALTEAMMAINGAALQLLRHRDTIVAEILAAGGEVNEVRR